MADKQIIPKDSLSQSEDEMDVDDQNLFVFFNIYN